MVKFFRNLFGLHSWTFQHQKGGRPKITVRARTEAKAWGQYRTFLIRQMYGEWALWYDELVIRKIVDDTKLVAIDGETIADED